MSNSIAMAIIAGFAGGLLGVFIVRFALPAAAEFISDKRQRFRDRSCNCERRSVATTFPSGAVFLGTAHVESCPMWGERDDASVSTVAIDASVR